MEEQEKILLLELLMRDIRGNWNHPEDRIKRIIQLCNEITFVPRVLLDAIKHNAETFDGHGNDGRIFRDGQMFLPEEIINSMGFPESMKKGVSGNMAKMFGAEPLLNRVYHGTYYEVSAFVTIYRTKSNKSVEFIKEFDFLITYPEYLLK